MFCMGSMIHLAVGRLEIDWGKNLGFTDHSALFQISDLAKVPYYYVQEGSGYIDDGGEHRWKLITEYKDGMSKPLFEVIDRIELLGHTFANCEKEFTYLSHLNRFDTQRFRFEQLRAALATVDVGAMSPDYGEGGEDFGKFFRREIFPRLGLSTIVDDPAYVQFEAAQGMENLSAYTILRLLGDNPATRDLPVNWAFNDLEEGGWAKRSAFVRPLDQSNRFLVVTEGSSDAAIIRHAFSILKPHVADFFDFVDMEEGYPFSGTGNLFKFVQGLISIAVQNNVIVIFDNDAEGVASFNRCCKLNIPDNMRILKLPDLPEFCDFETIGPNGRHLADINGQGAAIECYLGLDGEPRLRWNNYNASIEAYQGELIDKDRYKRIFLSQRDKLSNYDYTKITSVLDMISRNCIGIREDDLSNEFEDHLED
jgi:HEPN/Toprim N-terminal domain 1